jgi:hypothetical protein
MTLSPDGSAASEAASPLERGEKVREVLSAGERLLSDLDELGLSLAAAHLAMSLDMVVIEDRGRSSTH